MFFIALSVFMDTFLELLLKIHMVDISNIYYYFVTGFGSTGLFRLMVNIGNHDSYILGQNRENKG